MTRTTSSVPRDKRHGIFKKDRRCQYRRNNPEGLSLGHRRLRFSFQINDFKDQRTGEPIRPFSARLRRRRRCSRLGVSCQAVIPKKNLFRPPRPEAGEALFSAPIFCVKRFFLKKNLYLQTGSGAGGGGCLKRANLRVNRAFSAISQERNPKTSGRKKPSGKPERLASVSLPTIRLERGT